MILVLAATLAIVVQDHAALRAAPSAGATELSRLWQGDVLEVRGEQGGYLRIYDHRRERGGYLRADAAKTFGLAADSAPDLLAVLRFLRDSPGSEALGISYGAAYLKAAPAQSITGEPFDAIAQMAERLADRASSGADHLADTASHLDSVEQFGVHMLSFERDGRVRVCYDGELFRRVLVFPGAQPEQRARAVLALTRVDCIDPGLTPVARAAVDRQRLSLLESVNDEGLNAMTRSRVHARRAAVCASVAFDLDRRGELSMIVAVRARGELLAVHPEELGEDQRPEYLEAVLRVSAIRWAGESPVAPAGPYLLSIDAADPGQTCLVIRDGRRPHADALMRRCTYGIVRMASVQALPQVPALVLAVQPLEAWRELWICHLREGRWVIDVVSPGLDGPEEGYVDFAGFAPASRRLLIAREVRERGRFRRSFEELRLDDLTLVRQASRPDLLRDFGRWQDPTWRRDSLALH